MTHSLHPARRSIKAQLERQLEAMIPCTEINNFSARAWLNRWLRESVPALGGVRPLDILDTAEGQATVSRLVAQMQSGAYA